MVYAPGVMVQGSHAIASGDTFKVGTWERGFLSFNLAGLPDDLKLIKSAKLNVWQFSHKDGAYGPQTGKLIAESVAYGSLDPADYAKAGNQVCFGLCGVPHGDLSTVEANGWKDADVLLAVANDWDQREARGDKSQFRLRFVNENGGEGPDIYATFFSGDSDQNRPVLKVTYEHP
jgi:hypothetical protein